MDQQALVDKAVEDLKGNDCNAADGHNHLYSFLWLCPVSGYRFVFGGEKYSGEFICNRHDFNRRASELGWVSGYLWGKEYPTNGKKPDLPNKTQVRTVLRNYSIITKSVGDITWDHISHAGDVISFSIVDDACKPIADNSWRRGLPVEFPTGFGVLIVPEKDVNGVVIVMAEDGEYRRVAADAIKPIKSEREKFVEAACKVKIEIGGASLFEAMYDAGCRFVSKESIR